MTITMMLVTSAAGSHRGGSGACGAAGSSPPSVCQPTAAERGYIDDVIIPHETRPKLIRALERLTTKRVETPKRKHGNIPL